LVFNEQGEKGLASQRRAACSLHKDLINIKHPRQRYLYEAHAASMRTFPNRQVSLHSNVTAISKQRAAIRHLAVVSSDDFVYFLRVAIQYLSKSR
jgi:hypothetical protein